MEYNATAALGELPRGLAAGQSSTDYVNRSTFMTRHALTIATGWRRALGLMATVCCVAACSSGQAGTPEVNVPSSDEAWVASACDPVSVDTTGWKRYRLGDLSIQIPAQYTLIGQSSSQYTLSVRGPGGNLSVFLHRDARYSFDGYNAARRGQNWCRGSLGGFQAEIVSWFERFAGAPRDTRAGEARIGATYNFAARLPASWGGQDTGKWLFAYVGASRIRDAHMLRDALHTLSVVRDTGSSR